MTLEHTEMSQRVLVVEDDNELAEILEHKLGRHGLDVARAYSGTEALELFGSYGPDLVLLDVRLPDISGLEVCRELRTRSDIPVVILSVMASEDDKVAGFEHGADDYITKPFSTRELLVRIQALLPARQPLEPSRGVLEAGDLSIILRSGEVLLAGRKLRLPPTQLNLLRVFVEHAPRVVSPRMLVERVRPVSGAGYSALAESIMALRFAIEEDPAHPRRIVYVDGYGYKFLPRPARRRQAPKRPAVPKTSMG